MLTWALELPRLIAIAVFLLGVAHPGIVFSRTSQTYHLVDTLQKPAEGGSLLEMQKTAYEGNNNLRA